MKKPALVIIISCGEADPLDFTVDLLEAPVQLSQGQRDFLVGQFWEQSLRDRIRNMAKAKLPERPEAHP